MNDNELYEIFFSKRKEYYIEKLKLYGVGKRFTFNYAPLLFGIFWFLYRKMYIESLFIFIIMCAEINFENMVLIKFIGSEQTKLFGLFFSVLSFILLGFIGNHLYIKKAKKIIRDAKKESDDFLIQKEYVLKKGGTSYIPVTISIMFLIMVIILTS